MMPTEKTSSHVHHTPEPNDETKPTLTPEQVQELVASTRAAREACAGLACVPVRWG
jgi:hypothetical protein